MLPKIIFNEVLEWNLFAEVDDMAENLDEKQNFGLQERKDVASNGGGNASASVNASARIKRMRGWLGVKSASSLGGYDDGGGGVVYGDGHSGWNR